MDEERFRQGAVRCGRAAGIYWRKGDPGVDAPQPWQAAEGGQKGQPDAAARPGRAGGIPAGGERLAGAHQRSAAAEHATASEIGGCARPFMASSVVAIEPSAVHTVGWHLYPTWAWV